MSSIVWKKRKTRVPAASWFFEYAKRRYPAGDAVAHFIGYVAEITDAQLKTPTFAGYDQGRWIGQQGLERQYEKQLGGQPGVRYLEKSMRWARIKRWLPEEAGVACRAGQDLQLNIDLDLQRYVQHIFRRDSTVRSSHSIRRRAESSHITAIRAYDPNLFTGCIGYRLSTIRYCMIQPSAFRSRRRLNQAAWFDLENSRSPPWHSRLAC
jgi:cell division protein FtsI/penicillin-binding protein 2